MSSGPRIIRSIQFRVARFPKPSMLVEGVGDDEVDAVIIDNVGSLVPSEGGKEREKPDARHAKFDQ